MRNNNRNLALILCIFFGMFGAHRFYVGKIKSGVLYLLTFGGLFVGWIYDIIMLTKGKFTDSNGEYLNLGNDDSSTIFSSVRFSKALNVLAYAAIGIFSIFMAVGIASTGDGTKEASRPVVQYTESTWDDGISWADEDSEEIGSTTSAKDTTTASTTVTMSTAPSTIQPSSNKKVDHTTTRPAITTTTNHTTVPRSTQRATTRKHRFCKSKWYYP